MLPREIIATLHSCGPELPAKVRRAALKQGKSLVAPLCRVLEEEREPRKGTGYGDIHAMDLLKELEDTEAIPSIVALEIRYGVAIHTLVALGEACMEPLLAAPSTGEAFEHARAEVSSDLGVRDPRILAFLLAILEGHPGLGAGFLASYGDPAALPALAAAMECTPLEQEGFHPTDLFELAHAIEELGGELTPSQRAKVALDEQARKERLQAWQRGD